MPEIEITDEQLSYLENLREELRGEHVGSYGHVRHADAVQYLVDVREGRVEESTAAAAGDAGGSDADGGSGEGSDGGDGNDGGTDADPGSDDGEARLDAMMSLLDTHSEHWSESDADGARYEVELPDGSTERVRTRDDVRSLLFQHYR